MNYINISDDERFDIPFKWIRGDDEEEDLIFTDDQGEPLDFTGSRFDCDIVPNGAERFRLSTTSGEISVENNEITLTVSHEKTEQVTWTSAKWDLQQTSASGLVKTLCGGAIKLRKDVTYDVHQS